MLPEKDRTSQEHSMVRFINKVDNVGLTSHVAKSVPYGPRYEVSMYLMNLQSGASTQW